MARPPQQTRKPATDWSGLGIRLAKSGDMRGAIEAFGQAVQSEKTVAQHRLNLGRALYSVGAFGPAAEALTEALRLKPGLIEASRILCAMVLARTVPRGVHLNPAGLRAALDHKDINRDQIAELAIYAMGEREPLAGVLAQGRSEGWMAAARALVLAATHPLLRDELFLKALSQSIIRHPELELLLTAVRRVLLMEVAPTRFQDRALVDFVAVLISQCWVNEYVWDVSDAERARLEDRPIDRARLIGGDSGETFAALSASLYRPVIDVLGGPVTAAEFKGVRPSAVRAILAEQVEIAQDLAERAARIGGAAEIRDETSRMVAAQYESAPYPRWTSLGMLAPDGAWIERLETFFEARERAFTQRPFKVLIAGCGTGLQAIAAARAYGPNARVTAIDLSAASLAYAERMAGVFGVSSISFAQADILSLPERSEFAGAFDLIESVGVLHHMADPFRGWEALLSCLAPDGVMLIGLYSERARARWMRVKSDAAFPGETCDDDQLRRFRRDLFDRPDSELGPEFKGIRDLYTTSGFRDLMLHVNEHRHTIPDIAAFLAGHGLSFRGFDDEGAFERLKARFPQATWPGDLALWDELEAAEPTLFANMYRFWCARTA